MSINQIHIAPDVTEEAGQNFICQLQTIPQTALPLTPSAAVGYLRGRLIRFVKRRFLFILNIYHEALHGFSHQQQIALPKVVEHLQPGDFVQVKSRKEVQATLDRWNRLDRCGFMEEMWPYCGTQQQVLKRVRQFMDERDYHIKRGKNLVILKDVCCSGTIDYGPCDRNCYFFWREEWLVKLEKGSEP